MNTYTFKVVVERDEDQWHAQCPALRAFGAVTCGDTEAQARKHVREVVEMIVEELQEEGMAIPGAPAEDVVVFPGARVTVSV